MSGYLSVTNFWKYQDKNAWKKAKTHPPWFKHYVHRDREMDRLPVVARLLFMELLAAATRYENVLGAGPLAVDNPDLSDSERKLKESEANLNWLSMETRIEPELIAENLPLLIKGAWLSQTKSPRRGTGFGAEKPPDSDVQDVDVEEEVKDKGLSLNADATINGNTIATAAVAQPAVRDHLPYDPPSNPAGHIRQLIRNGVIHDEIELEAEFRALGVNGETALELRALLPEEETA